MKKDEEELQYVALEPKQDKIKCIWKFGFLMLFFYLGLINNLGYVLILTGASQLSKKFGNDNFNALYLLSLIMCSSLAKFINSKYLIKFPYHLRIFALSIYFFTGYISLFFILNSVDGGDFNKTEAFFLSLIPSFIMGTGSAFGEATILGYLRNFPNDYVVGWSSGTGLAGVIGSLITLLFHISDIKPKIMYLIISPICFVYLLSFFMVNKLYKKWLCNVQSEAEQKLMENAADNGISNAVGNNVCNSETTNNNHNTDDVKNNKHFNCSNAGNALNKGFRFIINLALVYYLEYTILTGFGERAAKKGYIEEIDKDFQYEYFSLCYQIGVFISRSSLVLVKHLKYVELFTIVQAINFFIWLINVYTGFITSAAVAFLHFIIVGLMGGGAYVACFYFILNSSEIENDLKELCINIASMFNDSGIFLSSITVLVLDVTIMKT